MATQAQRRPQRPGIEDRIENRITARIRRVWKKVQEWDSAGGDLESRARTSRLYRWLPAAIVFASLAAATMGWQASVADERAAHKDELSRQDLVLEQQVQLQKMQQVDSDLRTFGQWEQATLLGGSLTSEAHAVGGAAGPFLKREGSGDLKVADWLMQVFQEPDSVGSGPGSAYNVPAALVAAQSGDPVLSSVEPNLLRSEAFDQRHRGLRLVGLAVLFVVALVFFTCAAVTSGRSRQRPAQRPRPPRGTTATASAMAAADAGVRASAGAIARRLAGPDAVSYWFAGCGAAVTLAGIILFPIVRFVS